MTAEDHLGSVVLALLDEDSPLTTAILSLTTCSTNHFDDIMVAEKRKDSGEYYRKKMG